MASQYSRGAKDIDVYTQHVMSNISPEVFSSLNLVQIQAIEQALGRSAPFKRHPIDLRLTINLYFIRFYFVFLLGRDRRSRVRQIEQKRLFKASGISLISSLYLLFCLSLPLILFLLYAFKSWLGIDLIPNLHLQDLWQS